MSDNQVGRPTKYKPEYCQMVQDWGAIGKSRTWMAAQLDISRETIYEWERSIPEFSDAITRAMAKSQAFWEDTGQAGIETPGFNSTVWVKSMTSRFPADYTDKKQTEISGPGGTPMQVTTIRLVAGEDDAG